MELCFEVEWSFLHVDRIDVSFDTTMRQYISIQLYSVIYIVNI